MNVLWQIPNPLIRGKLLNDRRRIVEDSIGRWLNLSIMFSDSEFFLDRINADLSEYPAYTAGVIYI